MRPGCLHHSGVSNGSLIVNICTFGSLPDFELSELWLCPRFSTVDLGEVKSVRLKVDVHIVHTQQTLRSVLFCNCRNEEKKNCCFFPLFLSRISSLTLSLRVRFEWQHPNSPSPRVVAGLQSATARKTSPSFPSPPCTEHSITSASRHQTGTLTYFPTSSQWTLSSCEHKNKDDSRKK